MKWLTSIIKNACVVKVWAKSNRFVLFVCALFVGVFFAAINLPAPVHAQQPQTDANQADSQDREGWQCQFNYAPFFFDCGEIPKQEPEAEKEEQPLTNTQPTQAVMDYFTTKQAELAAREEAVIDREKELGLIEKRLERKLNELQKENEKIAAFRQENQVAETENLNTLVSYYEKIQPENAAVLFNQMDQQTATMILTRMSARKASAVLSNLNPEVAVQITEEIAKIKQNREAYLASDYKLEN